MSEVDIEKLVKTIYEKEKQKEEDAPFTSGELICTSFMLIGVAWLVCWALSSF